MMKYRKEIDGLRAIAVLPVILFHAGFELFSGGFVGVDIFFVISGYLIAMIIMTEIEEERFSIANFYERRARRILPALFFVIFISIPVAYIFLTPSDLKDFSQSVIATVMFSSNLLFWYESGYFEAAAELKPLLHTWSLAVEEQYYVLFPLFLLLMRKFDRKWFYISLGFIFFCSLTYAQYLLDNKPSSAFYLLPARAWELLLGVSVACYLRKNNFTSSNSVWAEIGAGAGLFLILYSIFSYSKSTPFPGLSALIPAGGACLIILFASENNFVGKFIGNRLFVMLGLLSYSAYLFHQPIFAFFRNSGFEADNRVLFLILIGFVFFFSYISWRYIETPFRSKNAVGTKSLVVISMIFSVGLVGCGGVVFYLNGFENYYSKNRMTESERKILSYVKYNKGEAFRVGYQYGSCFYGSEHNSFDYYDRKKCLRTSNDKKNYLVLGDSHSAHIFNALRNNFPGHNFLQASASGCRPLVPISGEKRCTDLIKFIYEDFMPKQKIEGLILSGRWANSDLPKILPTVNFLKTFVSQIYIIGPTVEFRPSMPVLITKLKSADEISSTKIRKFADDGRLKLSDAIAHELKNSHAIYVPIFQEICTESSCMVTVKGNVPIIWDYGHFTLEGSDLIVKNLIHAGKIKLN
jgi:peptidoglycan/LPS O-acetylase OafA/YrhL